MGNESIAFVFRIGLTTSASSSPKSVNAVSKEGIVEQITPTSVRVRVVTSSSSVKVALALGFAMPLLLMMAVFGVCRAMAGTSEMAAALYSLLVLIPYYILLYLCRNIVGRRIQISIIERL